MATIQSENLEERIERIRKRNEEIEKKYREAEEDRLAALKDNAMVEIKPPKDEDWPRGHKYDTLEFTYDVKEEIEQSTSDDDKAIKPETKSQTPGKPNKEYKKFAEGDGPPPDPAYNFLADAERDGVPAANQTKTINGIPAGDTKQNDKGNWKQSYNNQNNINSHRSRGGQSGSFRNGRGKQRHSGNETRTRNEYDAWKNEREKIDEERISRQKTGEGKWRREWDNEKLNGEGDIEAKFRPEKATMGDVFTAATASASARNKSPTQKHSGHHHKQNDDLVTEKRGNIMISVSQNGEIKSVKLTSPPVVPGTGRVGPRQHHQFGGLPQKDVNTTGTINSPSSDHKNYQNFYQHKNSGGPQNNKFNNNHHHQQHNNSIIKRSGHFQNNSSPIVRNDGGDKLKKSSVGGVQERLNKNRQLLATNNSIEEQPIKNNDTINDQRTESVTTTIVAEN